MTTKSKMFYVFGGTSLFIFICVGIIVYSLVESSTLNIQNENIKSSTVLAGQEIDSILNVSIKRSLISITDKTHSLINIYYNQVENRELSYNQAILRLRNIILDANLGKIGKDGYMTIIRGDGELFIHPKSEGESIAEEPFWPQVEAIINSPSGEGYIEYDWQNINESAKRKKVAYFKYFKDWDFIIWSSAYKSEFNQIINIDDFKDNFLAIGEKLKTNIFIISSSGDMILNRDPELNTFDNLEIVKDIVRNSNKPYEHIHVVDNRDEVHIAFASYIKDLDWYVIMDAKKSTLLEPITLIRIIIILGCIFASGVFLVLSLTVGKMISNKMNRFQAIFEIANRGDLTPVYSTKTKETFQDEIDKMGFDFNLFIGGYKDVLINLRSITDKVMDLIQSLSSSSQETSSIANQQAAAVKEIVSTMEDVDMLSKSIEKKIQEITNIAENTQNIVKSGFSKIKESLSQMEEINIANKETIDGIKYLSEQIDNIWDIVNMINGIADQTKIIAFNAELEASAAGEAGKNFQIVATEIRRLADSTVNSTNQIKDKITEIQKSSDKLILTSEDGTEKIKIGNSLTKDINFMFEDILSTAETSSDSTKQISKSINQQVVTFEQILIAIKQISEGVDNIAVATRETANASDDLVNVSETLEQILSKYRLENSEGING